MPFIQVTHHHYHYPEQRTQHAEVNLLQQNVEQLMAQIDDLNNDQAGIKIDLDAIKIYITDQADKITALNNQLTTLQQSVPPQVDLSGAVSTAAALKSEADSIVASFAPAPAQAPADATSQPGATEQTPTPETTAPPATDMTNATPSTSDAAASDPAAGQPSAS